MTRTLLGRSGLALLLAGVCFVAPSVAAAGSGGGGGSVAGSAPVEARPKSPEQQAEAAYKAGLKYKKRAWRAEEKIASLQEEAAGGKNVSKKIERQQKKAAREYAKAQGEFASVLQIMPEHYKAANELGYALRKQGDYKRAIGAYNYALQLYPEFYEAIEYRGEAFVALGFYDEAKDAYMKLFKNRPELAEQLMTTMQSWASEQTDPGAKARDFKEWIEQRESVSVLGDLTEASSSGW